VTKAAQEAAHDPRPSIEERYGSREHYQILVTDAAAKLVQQRYLLNQDVPPGGRARARYLGRIYRRGAIGREVTEPYMPNQLPAKAAVPVDCCSAVRLFLAHHDRPPFSGRPSLTGHCGHGWTCSLPGPVANDTRPIAGRQR